MAQIDIRYSNGRTDTAPSLQAALDTLTAAYPDAHCVACDGWEVLYEDATALDSLTQGPILVWEHEAASKNDPGAHTIASLTRNTD